MFQILEKITLVFEHYPSSVLNYSLSLNDLDLILKCGLYSLYHLHNVIGAVHGLLTPSSFLCTENPNIPYKLTHWAINIITNMGKLCHAQIFPGKFEIFNVFLIIICFFSH